MEPTEIKPRPKGRPKGAKNKATLERERLAELGMQEEINEQAPSEASSEAPPDGLAPEDSEDPQDPG